MAAKDADGVDEPEDIPPEFECSICMRLLLEPVSVSCGHTFCRSCLDKSLGYRGACAMCRAPVTGGQSTNVLISGVISERYPRALAKRKLEQGEELRASERDADDVRRVAARAGGAILALLPVLRVPLPHCRADIAIRTQEELSLLEYALQSSRRLGAVWVDDVPNADGVPQRMGVCLEIESVERLPDLTSRVRFMGKFRFRLLEPPCAHENGFALGRVEPVFDEPLPAEELLGMATLPDTTAASDTSAEAAATLSDERTGEQPTATVQAEAMLALDVASAALELLDQQMTAVGEGGRRAFAEQFGDAPPNSRGATTSAGLEHLSFWIFGTLVSSPDEQLACIESTNSRARLQLSRSRLKAANGRPVLNLPGAGSWMNPGQSTLGSLAMLMAIVLLLVAKAMGVFDKRGAGYLHQTEVDGLW